MDGLIVIDQGVCVSINVGVTVRVLVKQCYCVVLVGDDGGLGVSNGDGGSHSLCVWLVVVVMVG